eukprot:GHUV01035035.1.p1 GENE.GHUV01035035.1~~GHUV01035035.1.p1  ORF type:complete len:465 (+),score=99.11 GHUV01035035.1:975-2369(+)
MAVTRTMSACPASGLVGCLILFALVATLESLTMYVLAKFAERYDAASYGTLVRRALGKKTAAALSAVTVVYLWGSSLAYLVVVADTFTSISTMHLGPDVWCSHRMWLLLAVGLLLLPMCFPRHLSALEYLSGLAVLGFIYTSIAVSFRGIQAVKSRPDPWSEITLFNVDVNALYAISIVVFGFNCHANVVSVFYELEHYPHPLLPGLPASPVAYHSMGPLAPKPYTYKLIGMLGAIITYMTIILLGYTAVGITGYLAYPTSVSSNILNTFSASDVLIQVARAAIGGVCIVSFPLNHHPARKAWEDLFNAVFNIVVLPRWLSALLTLSFVTSTVVTAMLVTDLGSVLHMIGGTVASFMVFTLPGLLLMNAAIIKHTAGSTATLRHMASNASEEAASSASGVLRQASSSSGAPTQHDYGNLTAPLLHKKSGFREAGFVFAPRKSWWAGLLLVIVSGLVVVVTLLTA